MPVNLLYICTSCLFEVNCDGLYACAVDKQGTHFEVQCPLCNHEETVTVTVEKTVLEILLLPTSPN